MTAANSDRKIPAMGLCGYTLLGLILVVALMVRLWDIGGASFWGDEFLSAEVSAGHGFAHLDLPTGRVLPSPANAFDIATAGPWSATWEALQRSTHPPLYFLLLRAWRSLGGFDDDASLRMLSAIFSLVAIVFAFDAVRVQRRSTAAALWVAAVLAMANVQVQFAQEARGYSLLCLFMLAACSAIVRIEQLGLNRRRLLGLGIATLAMLLTHYLGLVVCGLLAIYSFWQLPKQSRKSVVATVLACIAAALVIWGPTLLVQADIMQSRLHWLVQQPTNHASGVLQRLLAWPMSTLVNLGWRPTINGYAAILLLILPLPLMRFNSALRLWTLLAIGELSVVVLGDLIGGTVALNFPRYTLPAATAAAILAPLMMLQLPGHALTRQFAAAAIVLACAASLPLSYQRNKPDYRQLAEFFYNDCSHDSAIVFTTLRSEDDPSQLALALSRYFVAFNRPIILLPATQRLSDLSRLSGTPVVDVVSNALSADRLFKNGAVLDADFFPGIGSCTRVRLTSVPPSPLNALAMQTKS